MAILFMVEAHAAATFIESGDAARHPLGLLAASFGGLAAPLFVTLSGWGVQRSLTHRRPGFRWIASRVAFLGLAQVAVNLLGDPWFNFHPATPGVLTLLALCTLLAPLLSRCPAIWRTLLLIVCALSPLALLEHSGVRWIWAYRTFQADIPVWIERLFINGTYPLLPWLAFFLLGGLLADGSRKILGTLATASWIAGIGCLVGSARAHERWSATEGWEEAWVTFFPASAPFIASTIAGVLALWALVVCISRGDKKRFRWFGDALSITGRYSLTFYVVHFFFLGIVFSGWLGWQSHFTIVPAAGLTLGFTAVWIPLAILLRRYAPKWSLEELLRRLSGPKPSR